MAAKDFITSIGLTLDVSNDLEKINRQLLSRTGIDFKTITSALIGSRKQINKSFPAFQSMMAVAGADPAPEDIQVHYVNQKDVTGKFSVGYQDMREYAKLIEPEHFNDAILDKILSKNTWELDESQRIDRLALEQMFIAYLLLHNTMGEVSNCMGKHVDGASKLEVIKSARNAHEYATAFLGAMEYFDERLMADLQKVGEFDPAKPVPDDELPSELRISHDLRKKAETIVEKLAASLDTRRGR